MKAIWRSKFFWITVAVLATAAGLWLARGSSDKSVVKARTAKVKRENLLQRVTIPGNVSPQRRTLITAPYRGYVRKLFVKLGDMVKAGDPIASVGTSLAVNDPVFPLRAPFSGKVVQLEKAEGEFVKEADITDFIARIDDLGRLFVDAIAPEIDRVKISIGQLAVVKASALPNKTYNAKVLNVTYAAKEKDRWERSTVVEFPIRLEVTDKDDQLKPGMSVLIDITTQERKNVLTIGHEFLARDGDKYFVTTVDGKRKPVKLGLLNDEAAEILEGVEEGEELKIFDFSQAPEG